MADLSTNRPVATVAPTTDKYVSTLDIHKPAIKDQLFQRFTGKNMLHFFEQMGQMEAVDQTTYSHYEEDHIHEYITVAADVSDPGTNLPITIELGAGDYTNSGTQSYPQLNDLVEFKNGIKGFISGVDKSVASHHTVTITPNGLGTAIGAVKADDVIIIYSNAWAEKTDQPNAVTPRVLKLNNICQILKKSYEVSGTELTNVVWFEVKFEGKTAKLWYLKGESDTYERFMMDIEAAMLNGGKTDNATLVAAGIRTTEGLMPFIENNGGIVHHHGGSQFFNLQMLDSIIKKLDKQYGSKENTIWAGIDLRQAFDNFINDAMKNGAVTYGAFNGKKEIAIAFGFESITRLGYTFHLKTYDLFNHPKMFGAPGFEYPQSGIIIPDEPVMVQSRQEKVKPILIRYKKADGYSRDMEHWLWGSAMIGNKTGQNDSLRCEYRGERGFEGFAPNKFVRIKV